MREFAAAAGWFLGALLLVFWPAIVSGSPVASADALRQIDALYATDEPKPPLPPPPLDRLASILRHPLMPIGVYDPAFYWIDLPNDHLQAQQFQRGAWPLWNPYSGLGTSLLATGQAAPFFPLKLLVYVAPGDALNAGAYSVYLAARLFIAAMGTYAFSRAIGASHPAGLLAGVGYGLCGYLVTHFHNVEATTAALLPLVAWSFEVAARRCTPGAVSVAGLALGLVGNAGHPDAAIYASAWSMAYALGRGWGVTWKWLLATPIGAAVARK